MRRVAALVLLILLISLLASALEPEWKSKVAREEEPLSVSSLLFRFLGESRFTLASMLWLKVEIYHHEFSQVRYWAANREIMPIIYAVTRLDPHFVQAYDFGGYHLAANLKKVKEGVAFLREGIVNNPENFDLNWELGYVYFIPAKTPEKAIPFLLKARSLTQATPQILQTLRLLGPAYLKLGRKEEARKIYQEILSIRPEDDPARTKLREIEGSKGNLLHR